MTAKRPCTCNEMKMGFAEYAKTFPVVLPGCVTSVIKPASIIRRLSKLNKELSSDIRSKTSEKSSCSKRGFAPNKRDPIVSEMLNIEGRIYRRYVTRHPRENKIMPFYEGKLDSRYYELEYTPRSKCIILISLHVVFFSRIFLYLWIGVDGFLFLSWSRERAV